MALHTVFTCCRVICTCHGLRTTIERRPAAARRVKCPKICNWATPWLGHSIQTQNPRKWTHATYHHMHAGPVHMQAHPRKKAHVQFGPKPLLGYSNTILHSHLPPFRLSFSPPIGWALVFWSVRNFYRLKPIRSGGKFYCFMPNFGPSHFYHFTQPNFASARCARRNVSTAPRTRPSHRPPNPVEPWPPQ